VYFQKGKEVSFRYDGERRVGAVVGFYKGQGELRGLVLLTDGQVRRFAFDRIDLDSVE